jgi:hypothetical protein
MPFGSRSTADQVLAGIDLSRKRVLITGCRLEGAANGRHPHPARNDLDLRTICRGIYRRARRLCAFLLAQHPSRTVVGLACRHGLLRSRHCVGRGPHHVDR